MVTLLSPLPVLTRGHVSATLNCSIRNAPKNSIESFCVLFQTVTCNLNPLFCIYLLEPPCLIDQRTFNSSDHGVSSVCQVPCEHFTHLHTYSLFQMCEVDGHQHFTEVAGKTKRNQVTWLWSYRVVALGCSTIRPPNFSRLLQKS